jgi:predicted dinucleotide-binding enzyme
MAHISMIGSSDTGTVGGQQTTVLIAGDHADAKAVLVGVISAAGDGFARAQ